MNHTLFQKHYQEQLKLLPEISQQAISSFDWVNILLDIGKSYALQLDELEDLQVETMMLIVGITPADEYEQELGSVLPLSKTDLNKLLTDINTKILEPIHDYIINGGPVTSSPMQQSGVNILTGQDAIDTNEDMLKPLRIDPRLSSDEAVSIVTENQKREDIIEHKLDDIFHETLEHVEHL
jgi:hypothetical protein